MDQSGRAILFHEGALGDSVLIWPLLRGLGECTLFSQIGKARLAAGCIHGVRAMDGQTAAMSRLHAPGEAERIDPGLAELLGGADRIISFISGGQDAWAANLRALAPRASLHFVDPRPDPAAKIHITQTWKGRLEAQGLQTPWKLAAPRANNGGPVVIHPGAGSPAKCWPLERYEALIEYLHEVGRPVEVILGEVEAERWPAASLKRWQRDYGARQPADLLELADLLKTAALFIGNDSGPGHLAAALGVPAISLFGPTDPQLWRPIGPRTVVLRHGNPPSLAAITTESVIESVARWG